jgi:hypothetical protein
MERASMNEYATEIVAISSLTFHPQNYRQHPPDQIAHLAQSIKENGFYRNIVISSDNFILAGHGAVQAAASLDMTHVPAYRLPITHDDPLALKVIIGDNEIDHLAFQDDRLLADLLKDIKDSTNDLLGTGFDEAMLANLIYITRPKSEIRDHNEAAQWVGLPSFDTQPSMAIKLILSFRTAEDRLKALECLDIAPTIPRHLNDQTWSVWFPPKEDNTHSSVRFERQE